MSLEAVAPVGGANEGQTDQSASVQELLSITLERDGSDLHLTAGTPPTVRITET